MTVDMRSCDDGVWQCREGGRRCVFHGGCCNWPATHHLAPSDQEKLQPTTVVLFKPFADPEVILPIVGSRGRDEDTLHEMGFADGLRWWLRVESCGAVFAEYELPGRQGGGTRPLEVVAIKATQGVLL